MIYIKIPEKAKPGETIKLNRKNMYTLCTQCGKEIPVAGSFRRTEDSKDILSQSLYCERCCFQLYWEEQLEKAHKFFSPEMFTKKNKEVCKDEQ